MPSVEVISYTIHTGRLGPLGTEKLIVLRHRQRNAIGEAELHSSEVYFSDRFERHGGYSVSDRGDTVRAHLPESEYVHWLDLLRYEDPVYVHWTADGDGPDRDGIIHLATGPEPPGEGPTDLSP